MAWYALASLTPAMLIAIACVAGGNWAVFALVYVTVIVFALDSLTRVDLPAGGTVQAKKAARYLSVLLGVTHFALLFLGVRALSAPGMVDTGQTVALGFALGIFFGQVSNSNAHDLIHARSRWANRLGAAIYMSLLFGHHVSAHLKVHHTWVATDRDPNSARLGESFYHFWPRAWFGSFRAGYRAENALRARRSPAPPALTHPYVIYAAGSAAALTLSAMIGGWQGVLVHLALAIYAQAQLMMSDYVQHYGLSRRWQDDGRAEPVGPAHSWNATPWYSSAMLLNAPRHSDHHIHPGRAFPDHEIDRNTMALLPSTLPVMGLIAACPPLWRRVMDRRVHKIADFQATGREVAGDLTDLDHVATVADSDLPDRLTAERTTDDGRGV